MADIVNQKTRSRMMAGIKGRDTKPEILLRRELHRRGFRFRLHDRKLSGSPDIILPKWKAVVFVHGCFWHRHAGCKLAYTPKSNTEFWKEKLGSNLQRDKRNYAALQQAGWKIIVVWECVTRKWDVGELGQEVARLIRDEGEYFEVPHYSDGAS